jgi:hypothetical protein
MNGQRPGMTVLGKLLSVLLVAGLVGLGVYFQRRFHAIAAGDRPAGGHAGGARGY